MINNLYTTLQDLAVKNDEELVTLLGAHTYTAYVEMPTKRPAIAPGAVPRQEGTEFMHFIVSDGPKQVTKTVAKVQIQTILDALNAGCSRGNYAINLINSYLTQRGADEFCRFLRAKGHLSNDEFAEEFVSAAIDLQSYYKGMPPYRVEVEDTAKDRVEQGQRYTIWLTDPKTIRREIKLELKNKDWTLLYLWFLLQPREMITKSDIKARFKEIIKLSDRSYKDNKKLEEKYKDRNVPDGKKVSRTGFDRFFTDAISKVNSIIREALPDVDDHKWYLLGQETDGYSLSITSEFVILPESLKEYIDLYLHNKNLREDVAHE